MQFSTPRRYKDINPIYYLSLQTVIPWMTQCWQCRVSNRFAIYPTQSHLSESTLSFQHAWLARYQQWCCSWHLQWVDIVDVTKTDCKPIPTTNMNKRQIKQDVGFDWFVIYTIHTDDNETLVQSSVTVYIICMGSVPIPLFSDFFSYTYPNANMTHKVNTLESSLPDCDPYAFAFYLLIVSYFIMIPATSNRMFIYRPFLNIHLGFLKPGNCGPAIAHPRVYLLLGIISQHWMKRVATRYLLCQICILK